MSAVIMSIDNSDAREAMENWAQWRRSRIAAGIGWPSKTTLGKAMDGMPGTKCPTCRGKDKDCPICFGSGSVRLDPDGKKANPAFIASTRIEQDDVISQAVDRIMCDIRRADKTQRYFFVLWAEFVRQNGTQEMKASQLSISHGYYRVLLYRALQLVEVGLQNVTKSSSTAVTKTAI